MPEEPLEIVRAIYRAWAEGDFAAADPHYDPAVVLVLRPGFPDAGTYSGVEVIAEYTRDLLRPWVRFEIAAEEIVPAGARVLAHVRQSGIGRSSGIATELRYFMVWTVRGGKVMRIESIRESQAAREAAGLAG